MFTRKKIELFSIRLVNKSGQTKRKSHHANANTNHRFRKIYWISQKFESFSSLNSIRFFSNSFVFLFSADSAANNTAVVPAVKNVETPNKNFSFNDLKSAAASSSRISSNQFSSSSSSQDQTNFSQTVKKVLVLTQLYTFLLLTCGTRSMQKKTNQPTPMKKDALAKKHYG